MDSIYETYALLEAEIAAREAKKAQLKPFIIKRMIEDGMKSMDTSVGKFSVSKRKVWSYPEEVVLAVKELDQEAKAIKAKAESTNQATYEEVPSLRFTQIKL